MSVQLNQTGLGRAAVFGGNDQRAPALSRGSVTHILSELMPLGMTLPRAPGQVHVAFQMTSTRLSVENELRTEENSPLLNRKTP